MAYEVGHYFEALNYIKKVIFLVLVLIRSVKENTVIISGNYSNLDRI